MGPAPGAVLSVTESIAEALLQLSCLLLGSRLLMARLCQLGVGPLSAPRCASSAILRCSSSSSISVATSSFCLQAGICIIKNTSALHREGHAPDPAFQQGTMVGTAYHPLLFCGVRLCSC